MAYTKQTWTNGSGGGTPLSAARLGVMETGIDEASKRQETMETTSSTNYALVLADAGKTKRMTGAGSTIALPSDGTVAFPVGTVINFWAVGVGQFIFSAGAGATLLPPGGNLTVITQQYETVAAVKTAANEWTLRGNLTTAT